MLQAKKVTMPEIIADISEVLTKIDLVLNDHEQRLQLIEQADLKIELELLASRIRTIADPKMQLEALKAFNNLCDALGITDIELPNP
jgi:hypothetical protein